MTSLSYQFASICLLLLTSGAPRQLEVYYENYYQYYCLMRSLEQLTNGAGTGELWANNDSQVFVASREYQESSSSSLRICQVFAVYFVNSFPHFNFPNLYF